MVYLDTLLFILCDQEMWPEVFVWVRWRGEGKWWGWVMFVFPN